jgi:phage terminase small subunit
MANIRGPIPVPAAVAQASGRRVHRSPGEQRKDLIGGVPLVCPEWLSADAATVWQEIAPASPSFGVDRSLFAERLARYCEKVARWRQLTAYIATLKRDDEGCPGGYQYDAEGVEKLRPQVKEWLTLSASCADDELALYRVGVITTVPKDRAGQDEGESFPIGKYA